MYIFEGAQGASIKGYIYILENNINHKVYIGQTQYPKVRINQHRLNALFYNKSSKLYQAIRKYGFENFTYSIVKEVSASDYSSYKKLIDKEEQFYIKKYNSFKRGYNSCKGGSSTKGVVFSDLARSKISERTKQAMNSKRVQDKICCKVVCVNTGKEYPSIKECAIKLNFTESQRKRISQVCNESRKSVGGLTFRYVGGEDGNVQF